MSPGPMHSAHLAACHAMPVAPGNILAIDVGGSGLKATVFDGTGTMLHDRVRVDTPACATPDELVQVLARLVADLPAYSHVAVGFPGMVRDGVVRSAPNLGHDGWRGYPLARALQHALGRPVRVANDADVQGLGAIRGKGIEMVITLGTGFGTGLYEDGRVCPHLEISHQPFRKGETYDEQLGEAARKRIGDRKWQKRVLRAIANLRVLVDFDHLFVGGGNSRRLRCELPDDVTVVDNRAGLTGGVKLIQSGRD